MPTLTIPVTLTAEIPEPLSAYQIAVQNGFVGTEADWLLSLKGDTGIQGEQGIQGIQGEQGPPGIPGSGGIGASVPGGRPTLVSGQPEMLQTADYTSTVLYYAPFESDKIPLFDGTNWGSYDFTSGPFDTVGLSMTGGAAWAANTKRDVFVTLVDGIPALCTGPAWPDDTLASRGLVRRNGLWVNAASMTCDVGIVMAANQGTFVGSINLGATGTLEAKFTIGQSRRCDVWNAYNQTEIALSVGCPPAGMSGIIEWKPDNQYPAWKAFNNDINNSGYYFTGLPENVECTYLQRGFIDSLNYGYCAAIAVVCKDSTSNAVGTWNSFSSDTTSDALGITGQAVFLDRGSVGAHRAIMGTANANSTDGVTLWGLAYLAGRKPEDTQTMWIRYQA